MEVSYYKDSIQNYMVIPCPEEAETEGYSYRMIEMNRIEGLLPCTIRHIEGSQYLYYEITGRQSLRDLFEDRKLGGTQFREFLQAVDGVTEILARYLLDSSHLVLSAEQIFLDMRTRRFLFTYYPGKEEPISVFHFLADVIDAGDKASAASVFRLCALEGDSPIVLRQAVHEEAAGENSSPGEEGSRTFGEDAFGQRDRESACVQSDMNDADVSKQSKKRRQKEHPVKGKNMKADSVPKEMEDSDPDSGKSKSRGMSVYRILGRIGLIALSILAAAGLLAAQYYLFISERERRLCIVGAILLMAGGVLLTVDLILRLRKEKAERERNELRSAFRESNEEDFRFAAGAMSRESMLLRGEENNNPDTIFLQSEEAAGRLYGGSPCRGSRIDLDKLPITIGKSSTYVDVLLEDPSVSRVHARIYRTEKGRIAIKDLGSTNGTWVDGLRINPNESRVIERGQEIRFGGMEYTYR